MKNDNLDAHIKIVKGLKWKNQKDVTDLMLATLNRKEYSDSIIWFASCSLASILFSFIITYATRHAKIESKQSKLEYVANQFDVENLIY